MKKYYLIAAFAVLFTTLLPAQQTPVEVLQKARKKCLEINNGKYTLTRKFKYFSGTDTIVQKGEVIFEKNPADSLFGLHFWLANNTDSFARYYNGHQMYTVVHKDKKVSIDTTRRGMYSSIHGNISGSYLRFSYTDTMPMRVLDDTAYHPVFDTNFKNKDTLVLFLKLPPGEGQPDQDEWVRWYIDAKSGYPIAKEVKLVNDGEVQYEHFLVTSYTFNNKSNLKWLQGQKWPKEYDTAYFKPYVRPKMLPNDTTAPDWRALTVTGDSIQLSKLTAKLYLVDFWYRACGPCVKAMPSLQSLHEKYAEKGLKVIGLNPFDYKEKDTEPFKDFIARRNVNYTLAFINREVADKQYRISGYPTFFLINAEGKIMHSQVGYGENTEAEIEEMISKYLESH